MRIIRIILWPTAVLLTLFRAMKLNQRMALFNKAKSSESFTLAFSSPKRISNWFKISRFAVCLSDACMREVKPTCAPLPNHWFTHARAYTSVHARDTRQFLENRTR